jgi:hypothetical protein
VEWIRHHHERWNGDVGAERGMLLDLLVLVGRQAPRLEEHRLREAGLAHVVQQPRLVEPRRQRHGPAGGGGEPHRDVRHPLRVPPGGVVLLVHGPGQGAEPHQRGNLLEALGAPIRRQVGDDVRRVADGDVAAVRLRPVERAVGELEQFARVAGGRQVTDPGGRGQHPRLDDRRGDRLPGALGRDERDVP